MSVRTRTFASTPEAATEASAFVAASAAELGVPDRLLDPLLLVVGEAVSNAARHGNAHDPTKRVVVGLGWEGGRATFFVEDEGSGLDEARLASADLPTDAFATSGRGLFIIRTLADDVWLEEAGRRLCVAWSAGERGREDG